MKKVVFEGVCGGDGECFCWQEVSKEDKVRIIGQESYQMDFDAEKEYQDEMGNLEANIEARLRQLYPDEIMTALDCKDRKYRFTIMAEEIG